MPLAMARKKIKPKYNLKQALIYLFYVSGNPTLPPFCKNHANLYLDATHLEKGLNRRW